jgi:hypothetical protein
MFFVNLDRTKIFEPKGMNQLEAGENCLMRNFVICTPYLILFGCKIMEDEMGGACSTCGGTYAVFG